MVGLKCAILSITVGCGIWLNPDYGRIEMKKPFALLTWEEKLNPDYGRIEISLSLKS